MKYIRPDRVALALTNLGEWKSRVHAQASAHLFPLLALLGSGAGNMNGPVPFNETPGEFEFWDRYLRLDDGNDEKPYFNPVTLRRAEQGFPHSNSATVRKNTFALKWKGATHIRDNDQDVWELADNYADVFRERVLSKGGTVTRVPVVDVAALLFRGQAFDDNATARELETRFRAEFPQRDADYEKIFVFHDEDVERLFIDQLEPAEYDAAISSALIENIKTADALPTIEADPVEMDLEDPILTQVQRLLRFGTSGIILRGAPGTGKSYYAKRIAKHLVSDPAKDIFRVQFHPSYGYEDFVEGYRPDEDTTSGYKVVDKTFLDACTRAEEVRAEQGLVVVIVDEINRGDPARVFGELLTYIEQDYRGEEFILPFSAKPHSVPENLIILGTMNPYDRSIAQADAAFVRRFDHIPIDPSREVAEQLLEEAGGFTAEQVDQIGAWFDTAQKLLPVGLGGLGHSYFARVGSIEDLLLVWRYRIRPAIAVAMELTDEGEGENITNSFEALIKRLEGAVPDA